MKILKYPKAIHTFILFLALCSCQSNQPNGNIESNEKKSETELQREGGVDPNETTNFKAPNAIAEPLVSHIYTADPSAHVFNERLYIYPSHDWLSDVPQDDLGSHFDMKDYHVLSLDKIGGEVTDHGIALKLEDVPWASKQLWAPDAAQANSKFYLYFPAKDKDGIFRIGAAVSDRPEGPFKAEPNPIVGSYSMDPTVYADDDGSYYMYFGGIWGGQLQKWRTGRYNPDGTEPADDEVSLMPQIARMNKDMLSFAEEPKDVMILDEKGNPLLKGDNERRFFEAAWIHKYDGMYYLSYSTGDTHFICYAIGDNPYGPFTYKGVVLNPVIGWTNHHSIAQFNGKWYIFYHDSTLSKGVTHLRSVKMSELTHNADGTIQTIDPYLD